MPFGPILGGIAGAINPPAGLGPTQGFVHGLVNGIPVYRWGSTLDHLFNGTLGQWGNPANNPITQANASGASTANPQGPVDPSDPNNPLNDGSGVPQPSPLAMLNPPTGPQLPPPDSQTNNPPMYANNAPTGGGGDSGGGGGGGGGVGGGLGGIPPALASYIQGTANGYGGGSLLQLLGALRDYSR